MSYKLFLDDIRNPIDCIGYMHQRIGPRNPIYLEQDWVVVRNYDDFVKVIKERGLPQFVSFDHDLGEDLAGYYVDHGLFSKRAARRMKRNIKSGYDCAKWLVEECMKELKLPEYAVHSMNPAGTENILSLLRSAEKGITFFKDGT